MKISQEKINVLLQKIRPSQCPLCHKGHWIVGDTVFYLNEYHENGDIILGGPSFPVLPIVCSECGNTLFINTIVTKLTNQPKEGENG